MSLVSKIIVVGAISGVGVGLAMAFSKGQSELSLNPGLWETTTTISSNISGEQSQTQTECLSEFDPEDLTRALFADADPDGCSSDTDLWGDTLSFDMNCEMDEGSLTASGSWTFSGDEGSGAMELDMDVGVMQITLEVDTISERVDDC